MLDISKDLWKNTKIMAQIGQFKNVSELFNFAVALVCTLQTASAFGCDEFYMKNAAADNAYKVSMDRFKYLNDEYGPLIKEMNLKMEDVNIIEIFNMLGGELFSETKEDDFPDLGEGMS